MYFCVVLCIVCFVTYSVWFVCICVLNYCHWVATQLQLNISYHITYCEVHDQQVVTDFLQLLVLAAVLGHPVTLSNH